MDILSGILVPVSGGGIRPLVVRITNIRWRLWHEFAEAVGTVRISKVVRLRRPVGAFIAQRSSIAGQLEIRFRSQVAAARNQVRRRRRRTTTPGRLLPVKIRGSDGTDRYEPVLISMHDVSITHARGTFRHEAEILIESVIGFTSAEEARRSRFVLILVNVDV